MKNQNIVDGNLKSPFYKQGWTVACPIYTIEVMRVELNILVITSSKSKSKLLDLLRCPGDWVLLFLWIHHTIQKVGLKGGIDDR